MHPGLVSSGLLVIAVGVVLGIIGFTIFYIMAIFGVLMVICGFIAQPREPIEPEDPSKKFCWFCLAEIDKAEEICGHCGIRQKPFPNHHAE